MKFLKKLEKIFSGRVLILIGVIVVVLALGGYSLQKGKLGETMRDGGAPQASAESSPQGPSLEASAGGGPGPANPEGKNSGPASVVALPHPSPTSLRVAKLLHRTLLPFYPRTKTASGPNSIHAAKVPLKT